jgi:hypothetical protein
MYPRCNLARVKKVMYGNYVVPCGGVMRHGAWFFLVGLLAAAGAGLRDENAGRRRASVVWV